MRKQDLKGKTQEVPANLVSIVTKDFKRSQKGPNWKGFQLSRDQKDQRLGEGWVDLTVGLREIMKEKDSR